MRANVKVESFFFIAVFCAQHGNNEHDTDAQIFT